MVRRSTGLLSLVALLAVGVVTGRAQELPPAPVPVVPPAQGGAASVLPPPRTLPPPPPAPAFPVAPLPTVACGPPVLPGPEVVWSNAGPPGWFAAVELDLVVPHIKNRLQARVPIDDLFTVPTHLPTAPLAWTVAPRFELGYRLPDELGEFLISYRFLVSEGCGCGRDDFAGLLAKSQLNSRLDLNVIDLDYARREASLGPDWEMKWKIGVRLANVFFDSRARIVYTDPQAPFEFTNGIRTSNYFFGAGPHAGLDLTRRLGSSQLALFGRLEGALVVGRINQSFEQTFAVDDFEVGGALNQHQAQALPVLNVQAGMFWTPSWWQGVRLAAGYQYEHWWSLGQLGDSRAELWDQGVFFRGEYRY